jgi:ubiquinone biosynthesis protein
MKAHLAGPRRPTCAASRWASSSMLADFRIPIPAGYGLLIKALVTVEGVARAIYPDIDIIEAAKPFATRLDRRAARATRTLYGSAPRTPLSAALSDAARLSA